MVEYEKKFVGFIIYIKKRATNSFLIHINNMNIIQQNELNLNKLTTKLDYARAYLHTLKWSVIPCGKDKAPRVNWVKYQTELPTDDDLVRWFGDESSNNQIGAVTGPLSEIWVIDLDTYKDGADSVEKHIDSSITTICSKTGSGGFHFFFKYPKNEEVTCSTSEVGKFVDIKGKNGIIILPPSINKNGEYKWIHSPLEDNAIEIYEFTE